MMLADLISRFFNMLGGKSHKLLERLEDPNETLDWSYEKMVKGLQETRTKLADVAAQQKALERQVHEVDTDIARRDTDARDAMRGGREDLARSSLQAKQPLLEKRNRLATALAEITVQVDKLVGYQRTLQERIERFRTEKEVLKSTMTAAKASIKATQAITGVGTSLSGVGDTVRRAQDRVTGMRDKADAMGGLLEASILVDPLDQRTRDQKELDNMRQQASVDDELAALRAEVAPKAITHQPTLSLPATSASKVEADASFEE